MTYFQLIRQYLILHQKTVFEVLAVIGLLVVINFIWRCRETILKSLVVLGVCAGVSFFCDKLFNLLCPDPAISMVAFVAFIVIVVILSYTAD